MGVEMQRIRRQHGGMKRQASITNRNELGAHAEAAVRANVAARGWCAVDQNVRRREGEIDLIALDGHTLVFAEVKALAAIGDRPPFSPFESIGVKKQTRIRTLARHWLSEDLRRMRTDSALQFSAIRFDAFAVTVDSDGTVIDFAHVEDAF
jgi:putative endonuclease